MQCTYYSENCDEKKDKLNYKKFKSVSVIDMEAFYIKKELTKFNIPNDFLKVIF